jgi:outer membrane protein assembly factor BamB
VNKERGLPLTLEKKIRVAQGAVGFRRPVVAHDSVYVGHEDQELIRLNWNRLEPDWRIPSDGFKVSHAVGELLLQQSPETFAMRGVREDGTIAWTLQPKGGWGWGVWDDRLYSVDLSGGVDIVDCATGERSDVITVETRPDEVSVGIHDGVLLLHGANGDPFRAFDLLNRTFLWERNLLADLRSSFGLWKEDMPAVPLRGGNDARLIGLRGKGVFAMSLRDGRVLWAAEIQPESVDVHRDHVFAWSHTADIHTDRLVCLREATGEIVYETTIETPPFIYPLAAFSDQHVAYTSVYGFAGVFRLSDGALAWSAKRRGIADAPLIARDRLFIAGEDGHLLVYRGV